MAYHPTKNPTDLPPVVDVASLDALPWGGNARWDMPIMSHVEEFVIDESKPRAVRRAVLERASFLMLGMNCNFKGPEADNDFEEEVLRIREFREDTRHKLGLPV